MLAAAIVTLPLRVYGLIQEEAEFALRSCCSSDPSSLYHSSAREGSGAAARADASGVVGWEVWGVVGLIWGFG